MRFILDAQIPPTFCKLLAEFGYEAIHTKHLVLRNTTPDKDISNIADGEDRIVITKDSAFYYSHILYAKPKNFYS